MSTTPRFELGGFVEPFNTIPVILHPFQKTKDADEGEWLGRRIIILHEERHLFDLLTTEYGYSCGTQLTEISSYIAAKLESGGPDPQALRAMLNSLNTLDIWTGTIATSPKQRIDHLYWPAMTATEALGIFRTNFGSRAEECIVEGEHDKGKFAILGAKSLLETIATIVSFCSVENLGGGENQSEYGRVADDLEAKLRSRVENGDSYYYGMVLDVLRRVLGVRGLRLFVTRDNENLTLFKYGEDPRVDFNVGHLLLLIHRSLSPPAADLNQSKDAKWHPGIAFISMIRVIKEMESSIPENPLELVNNICSKLDWDSCEKVLTGLGRRMREEIDEMDRDSRKLNVPVGLMRRPYLIMGLRCIEFALKDIEFIYRPGVLEGKPPFGVHPVILLYYGKKQAPAWQERTLTVDHLHACAIHDGGPPSKEELRQSVYMAARELYIRNLLRLAFDEELKSGRTSRLGCPISDIVREKGLTSVQGYKFRCPYLPQDFPVGEPVCYYSLKDGRLNSSYQIDGICYNKAMTGTNVSGVQLD